MPAQPTARRTGAERRGWLPRLALASAVSVVGVALAGTGAISASAAPRVPVNSSTAAVAPFAKPVGEPTPAVDPSLLSAYPGGDEVDPATLREAVVAERAAQRAEELAKSAEEVSRTARTATSRARQQQLDADGAATQTEGAELSRKALAKAVAARIAAALARAAAEAQQQAEQQAQQQAEVAAPTAPVTDPAPVLTGPSGGGVSPVPGAVVGAGFGEVGLWARYHTGLDFRAAYGTPIRAVKAGTVLYAGNSGNWAGNHVAVQHADGMTTMYCHMSAMAVASGQSVVAGQVIGYVGQTGRAFGPHLHFELYPAGVKYGDIYRAVDPVPWLRQAGVITR
jgi:murein DD-endopeptidase MepM/ murein hydrolase activator NlpD